MNKGKTYLEMLITTIVVIAVIILFSYFAGLGIMYVAQGFHYRISSNFINLINIGMSSSLAIMVGYSLTSIIDYFWDTIGDEYKKLKGKKNEK